MTKLTILNLIRHHMRGDETAFRHLANRIAHEFLRSGDEELYNQIRKILFSGPSDTLVCEYLNELVSHRMGRMSSEDDFPDFLHAGEEEDEEPSSGQPAAGNPKTDGDGAAAKPEDNRVKPDDGKNEETNKRGEADDRDADRYSRRPPKSNEPRRPNRYDSEDISDSGKFLIQYQRFDEPNLILPKAINESIEGVSNMVKHNVGANKFLFKGVSGTGKTAAAYALARKLDRTLYVVDSPLLVNAYIGETAKNISKLFVEIDQLPEPEKTIILFDEFDSVALDRINSRDTREMGRATSALLAEMERVNEKVIIIATTNLYDDFDRAILRRFENIVNFDCYERDDLIAAAMTIYEWLVDNKFKRVTKNVPLFRKIVEKWYGEMTPGEAYSKIKSAIAMSDPDDGDAHLRRLYLAFTGSKEVSIEELRKMEFSLREMSILTGISKSKLSRELN